jgi:hypothetical protein
VALPLALLALCLLVSLLVGFREVLRHEGARRRAAKIRLAPLPTVDELPDEWPPRRVVAVVDEIEHTY